MWSFDETAARRTVSHAAIAAEWRLGRVIFGSRVLCAVGRAGRAAVVAVLGIAALGIAAAVAYPIVRKALEQARVPAATPVAARPVAAPVVARARVLEDPSERCELQVFRDNASGETTVVLGGPGKMTEFRPNYYGSHGRLFRELVRQAVLLAARDELNVSVRDVVVGDVPPAGQAALVIEVNAPSDREKLSLLICRGEGQRREALLERVVRSGPGKLGDYRQALEALETLVRDTLPEVLRKVGVVGKAAPKKGEDRVPDMVEERLGRMAFAEQFAALRALHSALRSDGPSPRRLAALSRAYANLGLLTEFQWDAASVAYKARALLYAQRLAATEPKSPASRWHLAYATALAGIPWLAADHLAEARRLAETLPAAERPTAPGWVALIDDWCDFKFAKLAAANKGPDAELAALLHLMTLEYPPHTDIALRAARAAIDANPECFRAHDALCAVSGVANLHVATTLAPEVLSNAVPRRIAAMPGLPAAAKQAADRADEVAMTQAFVDASVATGDLAEPSWAALATIVRETRFAFTCRRLEFMRNMWSVPTDEYWQEVRPLVAKHRFRPLLESLCHRASQP